MPSVQHFELPITSLQCNLCLLCMPKSLSPNHDFAQNIHTSLRISYNDLLTVTANVDTGTPFIVV